MNDYIDTVRQGPSKTGTVTIGSEDGDADVQLERVLYAEHPDNLSSTHARFEEDGDTGRLSIEDLHTTVSSPHRHTGTCVNGVFIDEKTQLHPGDEIMFGTGPTYVSRDNTLRCLIKGVCPPPTHVPYHVRFRGCIEHTCGGT